MSKTFSPEWLELSGSWPSWRFGAGYYQPKRLSVVDFVVLDEKEDEMPKKSEIEQVMDLLKVLNEAMGGFVTITIYGDLSGHVEDGNDDEILSFSDLTEAIELLTEEVDAVAPVWVVDDCGLGCCYFLAHKRFGLRYPIGGQDGGQAAKAMATQLAKLANRDMENGWALPIGVQVTSEEHGVGRISNVDTDCVANDDSDLVYEVAVIEDNSSSYGDVTHHWTTGADVKVEPSDPTMRMILLTLASSYAIDLNKLGLLI